MDKLGFETLGDYGISIVCYAPKPDWWVGEDTYRSEEDLIDVVFGPVELELEGTSVWLDFELGYLSMDLQREDIIMLRLTLTGLNQYGTTGLNDGRKVDDDLAMFVCQHEKTKVKTVKFAEVLHLDFELAQFDALELSNVFSFRDEEPLHRMNITEAQLHC